MVSMVLHNCLRRHVSVVVSLLASDACFKSYGSAMQIPVGLIPAEPCGPDPNFVIDPVLVASDGMRSLMIDQLGMPV
jgi:hypothetical protein